MKRLFPPFLNPDVLASGESESARPRLACRQVAGDRVEVSRPVPNPNRKGFLPLKRTSTSPGLGMLGLLTAALLGFMLCAQSSAATEESSTTYSLVAAPQVDGEGIFLDQVVATSPHSVLPHMRLAAPPAVGQVTTLTRTQIVEWIQTRAPAVASTRWIGPDRSKVTRRTRSLEEAELRELLTESLQKEQVKDRGELELRLARPWPAALVADEPIALKIVDLPATGVSANFIVRFELWAGSERLGGWQVSAGAKVWREVLVAESAIRRGQLLKDAPVTRERRDVLTLRDAAGLPGETEGTGIEFKESVGAGQPILARSLRVRPVVFRGHLVDGVMLDGGMQIKMKVEVLEDGLPGHVVRVRNPRTRKELFGKVYNEQTIVIRL